MTNIEATLPDLLEQLGKLGGSGELHPSTELAVEVRQVVDQADRALTAASYEVDLAEGTPGIDAVYGVLFAIRRLAIACSTTGFREDFNAIALLAELAKANWPAACDEIHRHQRAA